MYFIGLVAEGVGYGNWTIGIETGLVADGIGNGDWAIFGITPITIVLALAEHIV